MKLHLTITKDFSYLNYLSAMTAIKNYDVVLWVLEEPEDNKWWTVVRNTIGEENLAPTTKEKGITLNGEDKTGRLDIIYLGGELGSDYVRYAEMKHDLFAPKEEGEFEAKDIPFVKVHTIEGFNLDQIDVNWVRTSNTLLAELIQTVLLERVWNAFHE
jgi:hypothetical protein